jgi:membrane protein DedA with SNARE-associated domain
MGSISVLFKNLEVWLIALAGKIPIALFAFLGSIIEEIVAPIPSPLVMTTVGSIAFVQHKPLVFLLLMALVSTIGKTIGCLFFYFISDKFEDIIMPRFGKFIGLSHKDVEGIGKHFNGTWKDDVILIILRAIPIMPSTPISLACGFIKLDIKTFIRSTMIGAYFRSLTFLYLGYAGMSTVTSGIESTKSIMEIIVVIIIVVFFAFIYIKRGKGNFLETLRKKLHI